ncbi:MAG: tRNA (cytidine(34)-2'-O)-methyltransferase [Dongiaceae bacterium]
MQAPIRLALFEPDIPQNVGTLLRLAACLDLAVEIIEPCGFVFSDSRLRRAGMDYLVAARRRHHNSWDAYLRERAANAAAGRLLLLTTRAATAYTDFVFAAGDTILLGRESGGVPPAVHEAADALITIPMRPEMRSLNVAVAGAMVIGEALRQLKGFPVR